jgi:hypothetical protein
MASFSALLAVMLAGCSGSPPATPTGEGGQPARKQLQLASTRATPADSATTSPDANPLDDDVLSTPTKPRFGKNAAHKAISTEGKHTGDMTPGVVAQQQNEFLGLTVVKLSKYGVRMESPNICVVIETGKPPMAYNSQNGTSLPLTPQSVAYMAGNMEMAQQEGGDLTTKKMGVENVCGKKCIHYRLSKVFKDPKTKKIVHGWAEDIWATKDVNVPPAIVKECAKLSMVPTELGFPLKIQRFLRAPGESELEDIDSLKKKNKVRSRDVIKTVSIASAKLDRGDFALLTGFKPVQDQMQFMMGADDADITGEPGPTDKQPTR